MKPVHPYPTLFGEANVDVTAVSVDGLRLPLAHISRSDRVVALHDSGRENWRVATLMLEARLPESEISEGVWSDVAALAVLSEKATNVRVSERLRRGRDGVWHGSVDVVRNRHANRASLGLSVVGTVGGIAGRSIAAAENTWYVDLNAIAPVRQQELKVRVEDFREGPLEWLRPFKDAPWIVDTAGDDLPTVYLNTAGVEGLIEVLYGKGGTPTEQALRSILASQIAQDAWTAMFHTAVADLEFDEDQSPLLPEGWRGSVATAMLPDVIPNRTLLDALREVDERRREDQGWSELQGSIQYAAGKRSRIAKHAAMAIRSARAEGGEP